MYLLAFLAAYFLLPRLQTHRKLDLTRDEWSSLVSAVVAGVIVGGRLGYVLFYQPAFYLQNPLQIFAVWNGGMSSHGGFLGVTAAVLWMCRRKGISPWAVADLAVVPAALGLALGRVGNFINLELYGIPTTLPWGIAIPGVEGLRHPTQIYAVIKDHSLMLLGYWHLTRHEEKPYGRTFAIFLMGYGFLRFIVEHFREQPFSGLAVAGVELTRGQVLTIPLFFAGGALYAYLRRRQA